MNTLQRLQRCNHEAGNCTPRLNSQDSRDHLMILKDHGPFHLTLHRLIPHDEVVLFVVARGHSSVYSKPTPVGECASRNSQSQKRKMGKVIQMCCWLRANIVDVLEDTRHIFTKHFILTLRASLELKVFSGVLFTKLLRPTFVKEKRKLCLYCLSMQGCSPVMFFKFIDWDIPNIFFFFF